MVLGTSFSRAKDLVLDSNANVMNSMVHSEAREMGHIRGREIAATKMLNKSNVLEITKAMVVMAMLEVQEIKSIHSHKVLQSKNVCSPL